MQSLEVMDYSKSIYLKKCPKCGSRAEVMFGRVTYYIKCPNCGARTNVHAKLKHAQDQWNSRKMIIFEE